MAWQDADKLLSSSILLICLEEMTVDCNVMCPMVGKMGSNALFLISVRDIGERKLVTGEHGTIINVMNNNWKCFEASLFGRKLIHKCTQHCEMFYIGIGAYCLENNKKLAVSMTN